jgi:mannose-6-phosphate isomerase-like protein (cupin superfamily)
MAPAYPRTIAAVAGHDVRNLKELDDSAVRSGLSPDLEARFAREALGCEQSGLSYQRLAPTFRQPFGHRHRQQEETYVVVGGSGRVKLDDEIVELRQWDAVRVAPGTTRQFEAGPEGLEYLAFGAPNVGPGDAEVVEGWWSE